MPTLAGHPDFLEGTEPVNYSVTPLPDSTDGQVSITIAHMGRYALQDVNTPQIQADAQGALELGQGDPIAGVFSWVKQRIRFQNDEVTSNPLMHVSGNPIVEVLVRPVDMSEMIGRGAAFGDCDDYASYTACLLTALGLRAVFVTVAADALDPSSYSHVYTAAYKDDGERVVLDTSHGMYPGWECPNPFNKRTEWPLSYQGVGNGSGTLSGLIVILALAGLLWWLGGKQ